MPEYKHHEEFLIPVYNDATDGLSQPNSYVSGRMCGSHHHNKQPYPENAAGKLPKSRYHLSPKKSILLQFPALPYLFPRYIQHLLHTVDVTKKLISYLRHAHEHPVLFFPGIKLPSHLKTAVLFPAVTEYIDSSNLHNAPNQPLYTDNLCQPWEYVSSQSHSEHPDHHKLQTCLFLPYNL